MEARGSGRQGDLDDLLAAAADHDARDPLASLREEFALPAGQHYLAGHSLGLPARGAAAETARRLSRWEAAGAAAWPAWLDELTELGDALAAHVLGAPPGSVTLSDSTSVNLYKLLSAVLDQAPPDRHVILVDPHDFPTNRYISEGIAAQRGLTPQALPAHIDTGYTPDAVCQALDDQPVAAAVLSHVNYRSAALSDMSTITRLAAERGVRVIWDVSHSAGVCDLSLATAAELAVGCTYKYLSGGPGSPGLVYVSPELHTALRQPIWGWFGQRNQFAMGDGYDPDPTIARFRVGTPPVLATAPLHRAVRLIARAGRGPIRDKTLALCRFAREAVQTILVPRGYRLASPPAAHHAGSHLTLTHDNARGIFDRAQRDGRLVFDFRTPHRLRLSLAPLYTTFTEIVETAAILAAYTDD
jgi:kynureninase